jgi:hypothetical protein
MKIGGTKYDNNAGQKNSDYISGYPMANNNRA